MRWRIENSVACESELHLCALRCTTLPTSRTRWLSPTAGAVPPLSEKEGFASLHHPLPFFMSNSLRGCTNPSLLPCGRRGTACGGGWRTQWLMRVCCLVACAYVAVSYQLARPAGYHPPLTWSPLFQGKRALLRCSIVPISRTRRLSPTAGAVPPLSEKEGFVVHHAQSSFYRIDPRACTNPSLLPCGRGLLWCVLSFVPFS